MIRRFTDALTVLATMMCASVAALCLPSASGASSGGGAVAPVGAAAQPANITTSASAEGMTIAARESALLRTAVHVSGTLPRADAGHTATIEFLGARTGWLWQRAAQTVVQGDGTYAASWRTTLPGKFQVRAIVDQTTARAASSLPTIIVTVYRPAIATLFGPGFYGRRTACRTVLRPWTFGVANRTLPCGTRVALYYGGRMIVVPVIDRGPYANGASWDLTMATGAALGMYTTATIGAVPLRVVH